MKEMRFLALLTSRCRFLARVSGVLLAGHLAAGMAPPAMPPTADSTKGGQAIEELDQLRADLLDRLGRKIEQPDRLAQWRNWPNWPNWPNWGNWRDWGNFWRNW